MNAQRGGIVRPTPRTPRRGALRPCPPVSGGISPHAHGEPMGEWAEADGPGSSRGRKAAASGHRGRFCGAAPCSCGGPTPFPALCKRAAPPLAGGIGAAGTCRRGGEEEVAAAAAARVRSWRGADSSILLLGRRRPRLLRGRTEPSPPACSLARARLASPDMARGQQKIQSQQKNAKKQAGQKKKQGHDQKAAAKAALIYTCTVCRTQMPDPKTFKQHFESKHPKTPLPPELADVQG
ncbi:unnamed protein product [Lepidochelys kempii]